MPRTWMLLLCCFCVGCGRSVPPPGGEIRVVSLAPNLTEIICAIGAEEFLVGRSSVCDYPPAILADIPVVGGFGAPSIETLISVQPTLVLEVDLEDEALAGTLAQLGIRRERIPCHTLEDISVAVRRVGELLGRQGEAERIARDFETRLGRMRDRTAGVTSRPSVYVEVWHDPPMTAGRQTFLSQLIHLAGGTNLGDEADKAYFRVSSEWVIARNPDIIVCTYMTEAADPAKRVLQRPGWEHVSAVRSGSVCAGFDNDLLLRPGPRALEGMELLYQCISAQRTPQ